MIRDAIILFRLYEEYYEPVKIESAFNENVITYEFSGDRYERLLVDKYLEKSSHI